MKQYISEDRAIYEDIYHGQFSRKLAEWAIGNMEVEDHVAGRKEKLAARSLDEVYKLLNSMNMGISDSQIYTAWYLFNMALADYPHALKTDEQRAWFVKETLCDPDGDPSNVLACFEAKMCNAGEPIYWEFMI